MGEVVWIYIYCYEYWVSRVNAVVVKRKPRKEGEQSYCLLRES